VLIPIEGGIVFRFIKSEGFEGGCKFAIGVVGAAVKIFSSRPNFL
jgi:hypothetical protein